MVEIDDERPIFWICSRNSSNKAVAQILYRSGMKRSVRPVFSLLLLIVVAATFGCRVAIRNGYGSIYGDLDFGARIWGYGSESLSSSSSSIPLDFPLFNSTLLKLSEIEAGETKLKQEIEQLLEGNFGNPSRLRTFATWRRFFNRPRTARGVPVTGVRSPEFRRVWSEFRRVLSDWGRKRRFQPNNIMDELVDLIKLPIDIHNGLYPNPNQNPNPTRKTKNPKTKKYSSCAVVGNSGILLTKEYGELIDAHEAVIRLNNARIESYRKNVGSKTTISFINSNILHLCARREDCFCHPYGNNVPIVMYICQPSQFLDYVVCNSSHRAPLIVTNPRFDVLCSRIVKYYSLKIFEFGSKNTSFEEWKSSHDGWMFHYSSGMQAVVLGLGICDRVSLFGFGKSGLAKHHYHTNQKVELTLHDYRAEYEFYSDLVERPKVIPFIPRGFELPPVVIHR